MEKKELPTKTVKLHHRASAGRAVTQWLISIFLILFLTITIAAPVFAADVREILSARAYRHLLETDDFCLVFHYNITHDVPPAYPANLYYHFRLFDEDGITQIGASTPYPYYDNGYGEGCGVFYFPSSAAPDWEKLYVLQIVGNPEYHAIPPIVTYTLALTDYSQLPTQAENQTLLGNYVLDIARSLEVDWSVVLVTSTDVRTVLNAAGENYFRGTIPGLQYMAPLIFSVIVTAPTVTARTWGTGTADSYKTRYDGTWVGDALSGMGGLFGDIDFSIVTGIIVLLMIVAAFAASQFLFQTAIPGMASAAILVIMGFLMGFVSPAIMGVTALICGLYLGYILIFRHG